MVFVDANPVETELIRQLQFIQVTVVERMAQLGIIERVATTTQALSCESANPPPIRPQASNESNQLAYTPNRRLKPFDRLDRFNASTSQGFHPIFFSPPSSSAAILKSKTS